MGRGMNPGPFLGLALGCWKVHSPGPFVKQPGHPPCPARGIARVGFYANKRASGSFAAGVCPGGMVYILASTVALVFMGIPAKARLAKLLSTSLVTVALTVGAAVPLRRLASTNPVEGIVRGLARLWKSSRFAPSDGLFSSIGTLPKSPVGPCTCSAAL